MASHDGPYSFARDHISYLIATLRPRRDFGVEFLKETASTDVQERIARTGVDVGRDAGNRHHEQSGHGSKGRKRTHGRERVKRKRFCVHEWDENENVDQSCMFYSFRWYFES